MFSHLSGLDGIACLTAPSKGPISIRFEPSTLEGIELYLGSTGAPPDIAGPGSVQLRVRILPSEHGGF